MIRQFVPQEVCLKCHGCCRFHQEDSVWPPTLLNEEIDALSKEGVPATLISSSKKIRVASFPKEDIFICSLFDAQGNKCKIYNLRPLECQLYPFLLNRKGGKSFLAIDLQCPFAAEKIKAKEFNDYAQYLAGLLKNPPYTEVLQNNPHIIQVYPEAVDLVEI